MFSTYVFIDNSNIWISAQKLCYQKESSEYALRLYINNLKLLAGCNRRNIQYKIFGSLNMNKNTVWSLEKDDQTIHQYERGMFSNSEQAVDEAIQLSMYRAMMEEKEPGVAVLLTGDGKGYSEGVGFVKTLEDMYRQGWGIEVLSWGFSCHHDLREFAEKNGVFINLDDYYEEITYLKNFRYSKPLSLVSRKMAKPDIMKSADVRIRILEKKNEQLKEELSATKEENEKLRVKAEQVDKKTKYQSVQKKKNRKIVQPEKKVTVLEPLPILRYSLFSGFEFLGFTD